MKKIQSLVLLLMVLIVSVSNCPTIVAEAEVAEQVEWSYDNSIVVTVEVPESRTFSPDDFPGINCLKVVVVNKASTTNGYTYTLIMQFEQTGDYFIGRKIEQTLQIPMVISADRNEYVSLAGDIRLENTIRYVPVGRTFDLQIKDWQIYGSAYSEMGVVFSVDTDAFEEKVPSRETMAEYGIIGVWPETEHEKEGILLTRPSNLEGTKSETGVYFAAVDTAQYSCIDVINFLVNLEGMVAVDVVRWEIIGGEQVTEKWESSNTEIADVVLKGGKEEPWATTPVFQTAVVTAKKTGIAIVSVCQTRSLIHLNDACTIVAFIQGDADGDDAVTSSDALMALLAANRKVTLSDRSFYAVDMDENNNVSVTDALAVLQKATGKLG